MKWGSNGIGGLPKMITLEALRVSLLGCSTKRGEANDY